MTKERRRNAERRLVTDPRHACRCYHLHALRARRALKSGARSPLGVPSRLSPVGRDLLAQLQAMLPGTWRERTILWTANRGEDRGLLHGRYPRPPVPVQGLNTRTGRSTGALMPKAARERVTSPRAGRRTRPYAQVCLPNTSLRARFVRRLIQPRLQSTILLAMLQATACMSAAMMRAAFWGCLQSGESSERAAVPHSRIEAMRHARIKTMQRARMEGEAKAASRSPVEPPHYV